MAPILEAHSVSKRFGGLTALSAVDLELHQGEILGLIGPNGAGKSVLLQCLAGALHPNSGTVRLDGIDVTRWKAHKRCHAGLGRTFQIPRPFPKMTVIDTVMVASQFGRSHDTRAPIVRAREALARVEFPYKQDSSIAGLNAVDLKRLDLARALASSPRILLLDELAAGLMTGQLASLTSILAGIRQSGVSIVMVEHVVAALFGLSDRVVVLEGGIKIADGSVRDVGQDPRVVAAYLGQPLDNDHA